MTAMQAQLQQLVEQNQALLRHQEQWEHSVAQRTQAAPPLAGVACAEPNEAPAATAEARTAAPPAPPNAALSNTRLWGYGEINYSRPSREGRRAQADLARAVFGIGYAFDSRTEFNSEYEIEHAVASASDSGEFEVEQFYVDRQISEAATLRAGLFLMPFGLLNEHHEPTIFYGVHRNFVETLIVPSTWREGGFNVHGDTRRGLSWNVGLTTGFDLSKWDFAPQFPLYSTALDLQYGGAAPLRSTHQELSRAHAQHLSEYVALSYFGVPGLTLGAAISSGKANKIPVPLGAPNPGDPRVTLWEAHARWTPGAFDFSALYARGAISQTRAANASNPNSPNPIPSVFYGYFAQAAYSLWERGDYRLAPFIRWERYQMGARYAGTSGPTTPAELVPLSAAPGDLGYWPRNHDQVWSMGANFYLTPHVVFKADHQWFDLNRGFERFDLGLGVNF